MRVRPNPREVERAAQMLVEAEQPVLNVGDEIYKAKAVDKAVKLAELLGMPVAQTSQIFSSFPQNHPLWVGRLRSVSRLDFPKNVDVAINVGNKLQHGSNSLIVGRDIKFIDMRIDSNSMGNVITTDVPLVADVAYGMDDLITAVEGLMTPKLRRRAKERIEQTRAFGEKGAEIECTCDQESLLGSEPSVGRASDLRAGPVCR